MEFTDLLKHKELPTVRITKVILDNFKSVEHGEVLLNCGKTFIPYGTDSDILGVYGQNGSGKTALIEALSILESLLSGSRIADEYADCISLTAAESKLQFSFDLQYSNGEVREAIYAFYIKRVPLSEEETALRLKNAPENFRLPVDASKVVVYNEQVWLSWTDADGTKKKSQRIIDTECATAPFGPSNKRKHFYTGSSDKLNLEIIKSKANDNSQSFIFKSDTLEIFSESGKYSVFYQVLLELSHFGRFYFYVIDTKSSGFISLNFAIPIYTRIRKFYFMTRMTDTLSQDDYEQINEIINGISIVLHQIVPGLSINLKEIGKETKKNGEEGIIVSLVAVRNGVEMPIRDESDGVRKIISILAMFSAAFSCKSCTVAIDELDAGIYEYLLGEMLQIFEENGKGQLIFTSHNLRPLEVLDSKFVCFTTTNPKNRYIRLKGVGRTNNLRDVYFREINVNEQEEQVYNSTKRHKIVAALLKAGSEEGLIHG